MKKEQKEQIVREFVEIFSEPGIYLMDFKGLNVAEITELRSQLREAKVSMRVVKNTLARRALKEVGIDSLDSFLVGPTGVVWSEDDLASPVRVLLEFIKKYKKGVVKAGMVDGLLVKDSDIVKISKLPGRQKLYTKLAMTLNAPMVNLARALNAVPQKFVRTVDALRVKKEE